MLGTKVSKHWKKYGGRSARRGLFVRAISELKEQFVRAPIGDGKIVVVVFDVGVRMAQIILIPAVVEAEPFGVLPQKIPAGQVGRPHGRKGPSAQIVICRKQKVYNFLRLSTVLFFNPTERNMKGRLS